MSLSGVSSHSSNQLRRIRRVPPGSGLQRGALPVPKKLRNAVTGLLRDDGYGAGYKSPHASPDGVVMGETYLPDELTGRVLYEPSDRGEEEAVRERLAKLRAARAPR